VSRISIADKGSVYNLAMLSVIELENMTEVAQVIVSSAMARQESRGAHYRTDYPARGDLASPQHVIIRRAQPGPQVEYAPVTITRWPVEGEAASSIVRAK